MHREEAMRSIVFVAFVLAAASCAVTGFAQPQGFSVDPETIRSGDYEIDPNHTRVTWTVSHFGMSRYSGQLVELNGRLQVDASHPAGSSLTVTVPLDKGGVFQADLDKRLLTEFFDVAQHPTATFTSTAIERLGEREVRITGNLTLKGVTKPMTLSGAFNGSGVHPVSKRFTIGFNGETTIKRSEFGVTGFLPSIGDDVRLALEAEFRLPQ
jgi:polyisoprenoid-binding protein YceI